MLSAARARARKTGIEFSISLDDITMPDRCPALGEPFVIEMREDDGTIHPMTPSLDRIDNSKGYVAGNVAVISYLANSIKRDCTSREIRLVAEYVERASVGPLS